MKKSLSLLIFSLLVSCDKYEISMYQQKVDVTYLASTHVNTPDPRQNPPPIGQKLIIEWQVPNALLEKSPRADVYILFWDYKEKKISFPITKKWGYETYSCLNKEFEETGGILTYRAEIVTKDERVYREWKHQLWTNLIQVGDQLQTLDEDKEGIRRESAKRTSSSVVDQSKQGSVIDTPYRNDSR